MSGGSSRWLKQLIGGETPKTTCGIMIHYLHRRYWRLLGLVNRWQGQAATQLQLCLGH